MPFLKQLSRASALARSATRGTASVVKTEVLRRDRASDGLYAQRLEVCRSCPGGHATFTGKGQLRSCGPMTASMVDAESDACGCLLKKKARDARQSCPQGHWSAIGDPDRLEVADSPSCASANILAPSISAPRKIEPAPSPWSRRRFVGRAVAAVAGTALLIPRAWAAATGNCYVRLTPCGDAPAGCVPCRKLQGLMIGSVIKTGEHCYTIEGNPPPSVEPHGQELEQFSVDGEFASCPECLGGCEHLGCTFTEGSEAQVDYWFWGGVFQDRDNGSGDGYDGTLTMDECGRFVGEVRLYTLSEFGGEKSYTGEKRDFSMRYRSRRFFGRGDVYGWERSLQREVTIFLSQDNHTDHDLEGSKSFLSTDCSSVSSYDLDADGSHLDHIESSFEFSIN